jgi:hypothetical protein
MPEPSETSIRFAARNTRGSMSIVFGFIPPAMTKLLDQALEAARTLSPEAQNDIAHIVLQLAGADNEPPVSLTPEEQAAIAASKAAAARGEFATEEQVRAVWAKHGL